MSALADFRDLVRRLLGGSRPPGARAGVADPAPDGAGKPGNGAPPLSPRRWRRVTDLLHRALPLGAAEREALLDEACAGDADLREEVDSLVRAHETSGPLDELAGIFGPLGSAAGPTAREGEEVGPYRVLERLGRGGMGVVHRARDTRLGRQVALKFLTPHRAADGESKERFLREARAASALDHPSLCTIHDIGEADDGRLFLAMACYEGETLKERIARGPLPVGQAVAYAVQMARGLEAAHRADVLHRDLKPANVMITGDDRLKILDFGLAKMGEGNLTRPGVRMGTAAYMSPEQTRGDAVDARTDVWSLGVVLYEMLTGRRPFRGGRMEAVVHGIRSDDPEPVTSLRPEVPAALERTVRRAMAKDPADRPPDMRALLDELGGAGRADGAPTGSPPPPGPSIAVLPFADMSPERDQGYLCEGMAEEILDSLARIEGVRVAARTSSFRLGDSDADVREIGRRLDVSSVLEGSVRKAGGRLRITVRLTDVADGCHRWSERYDREFEDIFAVQDEIAEDTVRALRGVLSEKDRHALGKMPSADVEAYDHYLRGRRYFYRQTERDHRFAREMFTRAIEADPAYARAYAGLSDCCAFLYKHFDHSPEHLEQADGASRKAVELAPELGETRASRGLVLSLSGKDGAAEREFETALRLNPRLYEAYYLYAVHHGYLVGNFERAARLLERAAEMWPEDFEPRLLEAAFLRGLGREEEARTAYREGLRLARRHLEMTPDDTRALYLSANAMVALGETGRGLERAARALALDPEPSAVLLYNMAAVHALAGEVEAGRDFLERAVGAGYRQREPVENDPDLEALRGDPRFRELARTMATRPRDGA